MIAFFFNYFIDEINKILIITELFFCLEVII